jgi:hypothetical protein
MRFRLIDMAKEEFPVQRICDVLGVSSSGYFAWRRRSACHRQQQDLIFLVWEFSGQGLFSWRHPFSSTRRSSSSSEGSPLCVRHAPATLYSVEPCMARP